MKVSCSKTKYMCANERVNGGMVRLQGAEVVKVQEFEKLGSTVQFCTALTLSLFLYPSYSPLSPSCPLHRDAFQLVFKTRDSTVQPKLKKSLLLSGCVFSTEAYREKAVMLRWYFFVFFAEGLSSGFFLICTNFKRDGRMVNAVHHGGAETVWTFSRPFCFFSLSTES